MMKYIALDQYEKEDIAKISELPGIDGIVLGDLYCNKRMFAFSDYELIDYARKVCELGLQCIYQTPRYLTVRNFDSIMQLVLYLYKESLISKVIVQDIGAASFISRMCPELSIVWGYMGVSRNGAENLLNYSFLKRLGLAGIETDKISYIPYLQKLGFEVMVMQEHISYKTVNRECYYMHENDIYDGNCKRMCLCNTSSLTNQQCGFDFSIDGYTLGKKYNPLEAQEILSCEFTDIITRSVSLPEFLNR